MSLELDEDGWAGWTLPAWEPLPWEIMEWPGLRDAAESRCYRPGETIIVAGRPPECVHVIEDGLVRVTAHAGDGEAAFLRACGPGQLVGEELLLPRGEHPDGRRIGAAALTECATLGISRADLRACLNERPQLWEWLAQDLIRRVAEDEERIMRLARDRVNVRLAWLLVHLARRSDVVVGDGWLGLPVNLTRDDLARGSEPPPGQSGRS